MHRPPGASVADQRTRQLAPPELACVDPHPRLYAIAAAELLRALPGGGLPLVGTPS